MIGNLVHISKLASGLVRDHVGGGADVQHQLQPDGASPHQSHSMNIYKVVIEVWLVSA